MVANSRPPPPRSSDQPDLQQMRALLSDHQMARQRYITRVDKVLRHTVGLMVTAAVFPVGNVVSDLILTGRISHPQLLPIGAGLFAMAMMLAKRGADRADAQARQHDADESTWRNAVRAEDEARRNMTTDWDKPRPSPAHVVPDPWDGVVIKANPPLTFQEQIAVDHLRAMGMTPEQVKLHLTGQLDRMTVRHLGPSPDPFGQMTVHRVETQATHVGSNDPFIQVSSAQFGTSGMFKSADDELVLGMVGQGMIRDTGVSMGTKDVDTRTPAQRARDSIKHKRRWRRRLVRFARFMREI